MTSFVSDILTALLAAGLALSLVRCGDFGNRSVTAQPATTTTSTTVPPGKDPALACQRAIERGGVLYAEQMLEAVEGCAAPGQPSPSRPVLPPTPCENS